MANGLRRRCGSSPSFQRRSSSRSSRKGGNDSKMAPPRGAGNLTGALATTQDDGATSVALRENIVRACACVMARDGPRIALTESRAGALGLRGSPRPSARPERLQRTAPANELIEHRAQLPFAVRSWLERPECLKVRKEREHDLRAHRR